MYHINLKHLTLFLFFGICLQAFEAVDKGFFESIDDALAEKAKLELHVPEVKAVTLKLNITRVITRMCMFIFFH